MRNAKIDLSGVVSATQIVHGVEIRGLNFSDLSVQWQTNGERMVEAYDEIQKAGANLDDLMGLANAIIKHAPDLAKAAFLAAINDNGDTYDVNGEELTAAQVWDTKMSIGKQADFVIAIMDLTLSEADTLKKKLAQMGQMSKKQMTLQEEVMQNITQ